jgi:hypothetical protein
MANGKWHPKSQSAIWETVVLYVSQSTTQVCRLGILAGYTQVRMFRPLMLQPILLTYIVACSPPAPTYVPT